MVAHNKLRSEHSLLHVLCFGFHRQRRRTRSSNKIFDTLLGFCFCYFVTRLCCCVTTIDFHGVVSFDSFILPVVALAHLFVCPNSIGFELVWEWRRPSAPLAPGLLSRRSRFPVPNRFCSSVTVSLPVFPGIVPGKLLSIVAYSVIWSTSLLWGQEVRGFPLSATAPLNLRLCGPISLFCKSAVTT